MLRITFSQLSTFERKKTFKCGKKRNFFLITSNNQVINNVEANTLIIS